MYSFQRLLLNEKNQAISASSHGESHDFIQSEYFIPSLC